MVAKLDRLARNLHFISGLMESSVEFVAADNPHASRLVVHVTAAFVEHERDMIGKRTKDALAAKKAGGAVLANPAGENRSTKRPAQTQIAQGSELLQNCLSRAAKDSR